jgi:hypothetical protein
MAMLVTVASASASSLRAALGALAALAGLTLPGRGFCSLAGLTGPLRTAGASQGRNEAGWAYAGCGTARRAGDAITASRHGPVPRHA